MKISTLSLSLCKYDDDSITLYDSVEQYVIQKLMKSLLSLSLSLSQQSLRISKFTFYVFSKILSLSLFDEILNQSICHTLSL